MFFLGGIEHRFGSVDSFSRHYRIIAQSRESAWRILDGIASAGNEPYPHLELRPQVKGTYIGEGGHLIIVDAIREMDAVAFYSEALGCFPVHTDGSAEPPEDFPEYVREMARRLGRSLTNRDVEVGQSVLLHAVSASIGETDWQKLRTKFADVTMPVDAVNLPTLEQQPDTGRPVQAVCSAGMPPAKESAYGSESGPVRLFTQEDPEATAWRPVALAGGMTRTDSQEATLRKLAEHLESGSSSIFSYEAGEKYARTLRDHLATSAQAPRGMRVELERLYQQVEGAYGLGGERHMQVTLADVAERLLDLIDSTREVVPSVPKDIGT